MAEAELGKAMLKEIAAKKMVTRAARREAVAHLRLAFEVSERRACSTLGADRSSIRRGIRPDEAAVRRLRELAGHSPTVRLSAAAYPVRARRHHHEP